MQRPEAKDVCSPYTCMQGIRKLTTGGYELTSQHHVIFQAEPDCGLLELEELACDGLVLEGNAAPCFDRCVHRDGEGASAGNDFQSPAWFARDGWRTSSLRCR